MAYTQCMRLQPEYQECIFCVITTGSQTHYRHNFNKTAPIAVVYPEELLERRNHTMIEVHLHNQTHNRLQWGSCREPQYSS